MEYYACNDSDCNFKTNNWGKLKSHLIKTHSREDLKDAKADAFVDFAITQDEFKGIQQSTGGSSNSEITSYSDEPSERLREVLEVNLGEPETIKKVLKIFQLSPWLEKDLQALQAVLIANYPGKKLQIGTCLSQYARSPYNGQTEVSPEMSEIRRELANLKSEREKEREEKLLSRIAELEKKLESGQGLKVMTIYDEKGNANVLPYDASYMEAMKLQQMKQLFMSDDNSQLIMLQKQVADLTKALNDEKMTSMRKEIIELKELAAHPADGKGILEVAESAGTDVKDLLIAAGKEVKNTLEDGLSNIAAAVSNKGKIGQDPFNDGIQRTPEQIIGIMETENALLEALPDGKLPQRQHNG
jgi:hypothetical protein